MNTLTIRKGRYKKNWSAYCRPFLSMTLCLLILTVTISTCYISVPVMADVTGWQYICTVWELIISLTVGSGAAPVTNAVNDAGMASQLGQMTVAELASGEVSVAQADAAIQALTSSSNAAQQAAGGIAQSFASTAADAAQAAEAISAAGIDGVQAAEGAMSAGENLANCAAASVSAGSIVGMLGMEFTGAAAIGAAGIAVVAGVGLGILGSNLISRFADFIKKGINIQNGDLETKTPDGWRLVWAKYEHDYGTAIIYDKFLIPNEIIPFENSKGQIGLINPTSQTIYYKARTSGASPDNVKYNDLGNSHIDKHRSQSYENPRKGFLGKFGFTPLSDEQVNKIKNGEEYNIEIKSPDMVNPNGNYTYNPVTNNYNYNYENNPTYNTTNQTLRPIYNNEYNEFINETNQNTVNNIDNSQTFKNFINNYLDDVKNPAPDKDPDIPVQPDKPTNPDITPEQEEQNKELMLPSNLKDYFPFCIPFDIYVLFTKFDNIEREAPHLQFELDLQRAGKYQIDIDFSDYNDLASLLRLLELIGFIMLLMVSARKIIGD